MVILYTKLLFKMHKALLTCNVDQLPISCMSENPVYILHASEIKVANFQKQYFVYAIC